MRNRKPICGLWKAIQCKEGKKEKDKNKHKMVGLFWKNKNMMKKENKKGGGALVIEMNTLLIIKMNSDKIGKTFFIVQFSSSWSLIRSRPGRLVNEPIRTRMTHSRCLPSLASMPS